MFDIETYLTEKNIYFQNSGKNISSGWLGIQCFWCNDKSSHLGISPDRKFMTCWRCGEKGSITKLIKEIENCSWSEAKNILSSFQLSGSINTPELRRPENLDFKLPKSFISLSSNIPEIISDYLENRGLPARETCRKYDLHYSGNIGYFKFRLIIPIFFSDRLVSFIARDVTGESDKRYKICPDDMALVSARELVYGLDQVRTNDRMVIVEGPFDQWKLGSPAVALLRISFSKEQINHIRKKKPSKIFILFDKEESAQEQAQKLASQIWFCPVEIVELDVKDPGLLTVDEGRKLMHDLFLVGDGSSEYSKKENNR